MPSASIVARLRRIIGDAGVEAAAAALDLRREDISPEC
jgi:hypothetical protein